MSPGDGLAAAASSSTSLRRAPAVLGCGTPRRCPTARHRIRLAGRAAEWSKGGGPAEGRAGGHERSSTPRRP